MALLCRQPVPEADTKLLHPFDATNTARQIGAEKTAVGGFVGEPAHGAKTQIDSSGGELSAGSLLLLAVGLMVEGTSLGTWFTERFNLNPALLTTWRYFRFSIAVTFAVLAVQLLYHFGPNIKQRFRDSLIGAIVAVVTWVGLSYLLGVYF